MKSNIIPIDVESIAEFFGDQPGGRLCLSMVYDICQGLLARKDREAADLAVRTLYEVCDIPMEWDYNQEGWLELFLQMIEGVVDNIEEYDKGAFL